MSHRLRVVLVVVVAVACVLLAAGPQKTAPSQTGDNAAEAARLNNLGAAYMNQQLFAKGLKNFEAAAKLDPGLQIAEVNRGIALLNLQRVDEARQILQSAVKKNPNDAHAWYNLGILYKNSNDTEAAANAFRRVTEIDPNDADTWYFLGSVHAQAKQYPQAIEAFQHALKLNPLHASAEFGLARAYQQSGDPAQARQHLARFQYIKDQKLGAPISLAYGEQGEYSLAEESPAMPEKVPPATPVRFVDVTEKAGIVSKPSAQETDGHNPPPGPGACFLDYDGDGKIDIFVADNGPQGGMALYHNVGGGKFEDVTRSAGLDPKLQAIACAAGDYDNDGATDLAVSTRDRVLLFHNQRDGTFKEVSETAGINTEGSISSLTFIDYDHDGDLDLYVTRDVTRPLGGGRLLTGDNVTWRNNGNGTFTDVTEATGLKGSAFSVSQAEGTDYNNDRAIDIVVTGEEHPIAGQDQALGQAGTTIFENPREGEFRAHHLWSGAAGSIGVAVLDFNHDGWMDLAFTHWAAPGISLWRNNEAKSFVQVPLPATNWVHGWGIAPLDYDNDGWIDLVAVGQTADGRDEVRLFRNLGPDGFKDITAEVGLGKIALKNPRSIIVGDYDDDGAPDLLITQSHGPAVLLRNEGGNKNNWLRLALKGLNDNKSAIGTKVEVFAGGNRQKFEIAGSSGYLGQNSPYLTVGLGQAKQADVIRMLWPTGVLQDEVEVVANRTQRYTEMDRRGSSCPTLFVWNGSRYELVADVLGAGVIGHWVGPGERNIPRPTEYVKVARDMIRASDGKLSFRLMEPMEEVVYLDQVNLLVVDHPQNFEVYPNEYFASNPPYPPFKVITSRNARPPAGARDEHGHNLLRDLAAHHYVGDFELLPFKGFTRPHSLELDLGAPYRGGPLRLLLRGEIEYFTATGMYAADQAGVRTIAPYVEALDAKGQWVRVVDDMGFPAGLPRTMVADLSGKLPAGTQRIRILTNLQIYWDSILVDRSEQNLPVRLTPVPLTRADLRFHGYPRQIEDRPPGNVKYVYEEVSPTGPYARQAGSYTRYGDVSALLADVDDRFAIFGSGEEVALEFDPSSLPKLPPGWIRDYFFVANGYEKDMDFYAADGSTVEPLPFREMKSYPGEPYPADDEHLRYLLEYNTRHVSGQEPRGYGLNYPSHD